MYIKGSSYTLEEQLIQVIQAPVNSPSPTILNKMMPGLRSIVRTLAYFLQGATDI